MALKEVKSLRDDMTHFEPLTKENIENYIQVGTQSYIEHYLHLWKEHDPSSYLATSFTPKVVTYELNDPNCINFLVKYDEKNAGILKISLNHEWGKWSAKEALYLHRVYLLKSTTGKGVGKAVLDFTQNLAQGLQKKVIWLEAMKKGRAVQFYQKNGYQLIGESNVELKGILDHEKEMWVLAKTL